MHWKSPTAAFIFNLIPARFQIFRNPRTGFVSFLRALEQLPDFPEFCEQRRAITAHTGSPSRTARNTKSRTQKAAVASAVTSPQSWH
eukprot:4362479-Prymnesium_polylepis.1